MALRTCEYNRYDTSPWPPRVDVGPHVHAWRTINYNVPTRWHCDADRVACRLCGCSIVARVGMGRDARGTPVCGYLRADFAEVTDA